MTENTNNLNTASFAIAALDAILANVCVIDKTGVILAVNQGWRDFFEQNNEGKESKSIGVNYLSICCTSSGSRAEEALPMYNGILKVINEEIPEYSLEYPCHSPTELRWFRARVTRFKDGSKNIVIAHELITERKLAEDALRISEARMKVILNNIDESFLFIDKSGRIQFFNQLSFIISRDIFGIQMAVGDILKENINIEQRQFFEDNFNKALNGNKVILEIPFLVNKKTHWFEVKYLPIYPENEEIIGVLFTTKDINEQKIAKQKILENTKVLKTLNDTKDKFFTIIAHDLRNPFSGILGISEILENRIKEESEPLSTELLHISNMIRTSAKSAYALLENLIEWAKTQTGDIGYTLLPISIEDIINSTIPLVKGNAYKKNISIEIHLDENKMVVADSSLTNTILRNLLTNAIKFSFNESTITVSTKRKNNFLEVSVKDNGMGINKKNLEKLFHINSKFSKAGTENEKGTGLGLILCDEFIRKQGGTIKVQSELEKGTTFTFTLPLVL